MKYPDLYTEEDIQKAKDFICDSARELIPIEIERLQVSQWAENERTLASGLSPYPGAYSFEVAPYLKEVVDSLSESSPIREIAVMKGTQIGYTVGVIENWIGYCIDVAPAPMLYVTGDAGMAATQMELRIDSLINNSGLADKIGSQTRRAGQRKTGDVKMRKEFPGGFLVATGPNSGVKLRAISVKYACVDEADAFPQSTGKEGSTTDLITRRMDAFSEQYKISWGSTPLLKHSSQILQLYKKGDQRKYFVPCKHCGHMQYLKWNVKESEKTKRSGIHFDVDKEGALIFSQNKHGEMTGSSVRYICEKCGGEWKNSDKDYFLPLGEWRPTAKPKKPGMRSYHIPALLSPVGFRSWESAVIDFLQIKSEDFPPLKFQNWINTFLGEPFEVRGTRPRIEMLLARERRYSIGSLPEDAKPLLITIGADVQQDRIECEIVAWGKDAESWSINYQVIHGDTEDLDGEAWMSFKEVITTRYAGISPILTGIDAGYKTDTVYSFCDSFEGGVLPVMGSDQIVKAREHIRTVQMRGHRVPRIDINTDLMKQELYRYLNRGQYESGAYPRGFCHFPREYNPKHMIRLTSEERVPIHSKNGRVRHGWHKLQKRNEQLDCRVYALAMVYTYRHYIELTLREEEKIEKDYVVTFDEFWDYIKENPP